MRVFKFGGTSLATGANIRLTERIVRRAFKEDPDIIVVCSALGGVTNELLRIADMASKKDDRYVDTLNALKARHQEVAISLLQGRYLEKYMSRIKRDFSRLEELVRGIYLLREISARTKDYLLSFGEINSTFLTHSFYHQSGLENRYLDTRKVIITDEGFNAAAHIQDLTYDNINAFYGETRGLVVATGFIAASRQGWTSTLGRGGSDLTASIFGAALDAVEVEIWTDVDGVLSSNPQMVDEPKSIAHLTYNEAMEISHFGAKVIFAPTIKPLLEDAIPLRVKNTFNPDHPGTIISQDFDSNSSPVKGVSSIEDISLVILKGPGMVGIPGTAARLFGALASHSINIILITQGSSEHSICFGVKPEDSERAGKILEETFAQEILSGSINVPEIIDDLSVIALVGENMKYRHGIAGKIFSTLGDHHINVIAIAQGSSELNISMVIIKEDLKPALNAIHKTFFSVRIKLIHLYVVGVGQVGKTFLDQLQNQRNALLEHHDLDIKVVGIANTKTMFFDSAGINLENWPRQLSDSHTTSDLTSFIQKAQHYDLPNSTLVDITSSTDVSQLYDKAILAGMSIATPNKIAFSSSKNDYAKLLDYARYKSQFVVFETTVGAGLPIINTIQGLLKSGDRIHRIQGILSGSLSFIFSELAAGKSFSEAVLLARENGFTEPDPRTDISGLDFKRKLVILSNLAGFEHTIEDIQMEAILDTSIMEGLTVETFLKVLPEYDKEFSEKTLAAGDKKLRLIGELSAEKAAIKMMAVDADHPFFHLSGSDNILAIHSDRYNTNPLIIRGPGAGPQVTAGGLMADIIASYNV